MTQILIGQAHSLHPHGIQEILHICLLANSRRHGAVNRGRTNVGDTLATRFCWCFEPVWLRRWHFSPLLSVPPFPFLCAQRKARIYINRIFGSAGSCVEACTPCARSDERGRQSKARTHGWRFPSARKRWRRSRRDLRRE